MTQDVHIIFDDTNPTGDIIADVIGDKGFADVIVRRKKLSAHFCDHLTALFPGARIQVLRSPYDIAPLAQSFSGASGQDGTRILHFFSHVAIADIEAARLTLEKLPFVDQTYRVTCGQTCAAVMFCQARAYHAFLLDAQNTSSQAAAQKVVPSMQAAGLVDIGITEHFIQCITGSFDARYFNSLTGSERTIVKSSANKTKIHAEYQFWHLLPDDMKPFFVMPFDYKETESRAQYTMERLHITDLAIKYVHGSIGKAEFSEILDTYFAFFKSRHKKPVTQEQYRRTADFLYKDKVRERIDAFKALPLYPRISALLSASGMGDMDALFATYLDVRAAVESRVTFEPVSVIGHGDPCFANVLYNRATKLFKLIDPRGALCEQDLWTDPYYDVAKLSHSACGRYDFFNNGLFDIRVDESFGLDLHVDFDATPFTQLFRHKLEQNGFDYLCVRTYEASLFLSMLPLHRDYPHKVLAFILNAIAILQEVQHEL